MNWPYRDSGYLTAKTPSWLWVLWCMLRISVSPRRCKALYHTVMTYHQRGYPDLARQHKRLAGELWGPDVPENWDPEHAQEKT